MITKHGVSAVLLLCFWALIVFVWYLPNIPLFFLPLLLLPASSREFCAQNIRDCLNTWISISYDKNHSCLDWVRLGIGMFWRRHLQVRTSQMSCLMKNVEDATLKKNFSCDLLNFFHLKCPTYQVCPQLWNRSSIDWLPADVRFKVFRLINCIVFLCIIYLLFS